MKKYQIKISISFIMISFIAYTFFVFPHISKNNIELIVNKPIENFHILKWQCSSSYCCPNIYKKAIVIAKVSKNEYYLLNIESGIDLTENSWHLPGIFMDYFPTEIKKINNYPQNKEIESFLNECSYNFNGINELNLWLSK
jgi:hypothetical protein